MKTITAIEGVGYKNADVLQEHGIRTVDQLLDRTATASGRRGLAAETGISATTLLEWANRADLMRIKGVGSEYSDLLEAAGVDTVKELARRNPTNLTEQLADANTAHRRKTGRRLVRRVPALSRVESWIDQAAGLPQVITH